MDNFAALVWDNAERGGGRIALRGSGRELTYAALRDAAAGVAGAVAAAGVAQGDRVLLLAPSVPDFAAVYYGLLTGGAVVVTVNTMSTQTELEYVLKDADCSLVIAWQDGDAGGARAAASALDLPCWSVGPGLDELPQARPVSGPVERRWPTRR